MIKTLVVNDPVNGENYEAFVFLSMKSSHFKLYDKVLESLSPGQIKDEKQIE